MLAKKAVVLLSGGLDSTLAVRILQAQEVEIEAINFRTSFACCKDDALEIARKFGVKVTVMTVGDEYFKLIEKPKYGWGKGINPCVDCRIYMFQMARKFMETCGASFVASGEVLGQRPMSQQGHQLHTIEGESGLRDVLLRPLSAKLLEPTLPERMGLVDRERLYAISGRSRKELLELAREFGITEPPTPSTGCLLTEPDFADKVRDLFDHEKHYERWHFETLKVGRQFRLSSKTKVILGRNQEENQRLELLNRNGSTLYVPCSFKGPSALVIGERDGETERRVCGMILRYSKHDRIPVPVFEAAGDASAGGPVETGILFERRQDGVAEKITVQAASLSEEEVAAYRI